ncbi:MAG: hypothetical protein A2711_10135 [Burkholderiales bacterium RIFCSPHIGHO2_01_FULL_63_240]|nr:MAG: hypothetical protein A2711_10135 [Burkholderiales bacterium RIFCSPHIGHO2_01_FULL_63_240]
MCFFQEHPSVLHALLTRMARLMLAAALACPTLALAAPPAEPLQQLARDRQLANTPMWHALLHYQRHPLTRQLRSLADDPGFFLAPQGRTDPQAELDATIAAFFDPTPRHALDQAAACRFIARERWLRQELGAAPGLWPQAQCERFAQWRAGLRADRVSMIFPSAYLNSPASMYGHTFLRLDAAQGDGAGSPMLSYAINYAANGDQNEGLAFAFKGLVGLYPGQFTNAPYYLRIREYNDLENRDIWEYELNLQSEEIERLLAHTWELGPTRFDYYFFDENCSYHLLALLDAARPGWNLVGDFTWWAIPVDTIRAVMRTPGMLKAVRYRPANSTELRERAHRLGPDNARLARDIADGTQPPEAVQSANLTPAQQALALETAERLVAYDAVREGWSETQAQARRMPLLRARATLPAGEAVTVPTPKDDPTTGHATARIDVMAGRRAGRDWYTFTARPAYHDLLDPPAGYQRGAAIQFFQTVLSRSAHGDVQLERFTPVDITSLSPHEPLLRARSWRVGMHLRRDPFGQADERRRMGAEVRGGPGWAWLLEGVGDLMPYAFVDNHLQWDRRRADQPWALGSGLAAGLLWQATPRWGLQLEGHGRAYVGGLPKEWGWSLQTRLHPHADWSLNGQIQQQHRERTTPVTTWGLGLMRHW